MTAPARLPADIEEAIATCEKIVDDDTDKISDSLDVLDGTPEEIFEGDTSIVRHVEDLRTTSRRAQRSARASRPPYATPEKAR